MTPTTIPAHSTHPAVGGASRPNPTTGNTNTNNPTTGSTTTNNPTTGTTRRALLKPASVNIEIDQGRRTAPDLIGTTP